MDLTCYQFMRLCVSFTFLILYYKKDTHPPSPPPLVCFIILFFFFLRLLFGLDYVGIVVRISSFHLQGPAITSHILNILTFLLLISLAPEKVPKSSGVLMPKFLRYTSLRHHLEEPYV